MATGFVGKDERLTAAEKKLLKAAGHKLGKAKDKLGADDEKREKADLGQEGTRTRAALAKAVSKLTRLRSAVDTSKPEAKAKPRKPGSTTKRPSDDARVRRDRKAMRKAVHANQKGSN